MATESPKQRSDEATLTSTTEPTITIDTDSQNVDLNRPHLNGDAPASATDEFENKHISDIVDDLVNSTEVSISGGSDTEAAKSDASKGKDGVKSRAVKKPASFKAINVNKTFLTAKAAAPGTQPKTSEKAPPSTSASPAPSGTLTAARPRLVAKSASGLVPKAGGANGGKSAPDASAVWNKNRPVPPPEPKKYTDEELKKYGIHMATRLNADDARGQSNWADIDDDDEDWDPDTITWKDGTKIAIAHTEEHPPPPPPEPAPRPTVSVSVRENGPVEKAKVPAAGASPSIKPGVLASGKGLVLKGAPEKPTLVAKPPAPPTPAKSPWAPLPKIDKVSPVASEMPPQGGPRYPPRDPAMYHPTHGPPPPKEIAADDFSRAAWRDGAPGANRELYNSQSGRYEPVPDRRGPMRQEPPPHGRQPALLQRPLPHEQHGPPGPPGPPEPPGPFRPSGNNEQQGPYGRRRGSSNVSGGSGSWQRPLPPPDLANARRPSMVGNDDFSPSGLQGGPPHGQPWQHRPSPGTAHATPYHPGGQGPDVQGMPPMAHPVSPSAASVVPVTEQDYELQKRLMRERRELAMRRRQEEEAREEAARKERIRLKLEALGPAPESNKVKKAVAKEQAATPTQIQSREDSATQKPEPAPEPSQAPADDKDASAPAVPEPANRSTGPAQAVPQQPESVEHRSQPQSSTTAHPWVPASRQGDRQPSGWGLQPSTSKNVWAAPNSNRSLGNGTFVADLGTSQLPQLPSQAGPGPIAPPNSTRATNAPQASIPPATGWQPPIGPSGRAQGSRGVGEREMKDNAWTTAVRLNDEMFSEMLNTQYEERERRLQSEGRSLTDIQPAIKDTWRPTKLDESGARAEAAPKQTLQIGQENPWVASAESKPVAPQTAPSVSGGGPSEYSQLPPSIVPARDMAPGSILGGAKAAQPQQGRASRFFPSRDVRQETRDIRLEMNAEALRHVSPSPPPPDMDGHPAFDGDATHPHVSLPRPYPVVRLPPSVAKETPPSAPEVVSRAPTGPSKPQGPTFSWAAQTAYKEESGTPRAPGHKQDNSWQAKIDSLLGGRKVHQPKLVGSDGGARGSHSQQEPSSPGTSTTRPDGSVISKVMAEECFEEQEMGSVPPIRLPKTIPEMAWQPSPTPKPLSKKLHPAVFSADSISFPVDVSGAGTVWRVCIPGGESKSITIPFGRTRSNPRRGGQRGGRHPSSAGGHGRGKAREGSSSYSAETGANASGSNNASHGRNSRGGYRGRENWSRNATPQVQT